ncbi:MAG: hypothetical protein ACKE8G_03515 [Methylophagaceae bacterium]
MGYILLLGVALLFFVLWLYSEWNVKRKINDAFIGRESLSNETFYTIYFKETGISKQVVNGVKQVLEEQLAADLSRLSAEDDFSKNLNFFWELDSLADVEIIIALEEKFNIKIEDFEAEQTFTVRDIVNLVSDKLGN